MVSVQGNRVLLTAINPHVSKLTACFSLLIKFQAACRSSRASNVDVFWHFGIRDETDDNGWEDEAAYCMHDNVGIPRYGSAGWWPFS